MDHQGCTYAVAREISKKYELDGDTHKGETEAQKRRHQASQWPNTGYTTEGRGFVPPILYLRG
jgi:hypothetical protein